MFSEIQCLLPTVDNDGVAFTAADFAAFEAVLLDHFDGFSLLPAHVVGAWRDPATGRVYRDDLRVYAVWATEPGIPDALRPVAEYAKVAFRQEAIGIRLPAEGKAAIL